MITTIGKAYEQRDGVYVKTVRPAEDNIADDVLVVWRDSRMISEEQRRKAYALIGDITVFAGYLPREKETVNQHLKQRFLMQQVEEYQRKMFSLSDCTMTEAREYINFLIDFCLEEDVPTKRPLIELVDDIEKYVYGSLLRKKCAVCGRKTELHHCQAIGMGYDRREKPQLGALVMPLCALHHQECHKIGNDRYFKLQHLTPVRLDQKLAKVYGLTEAAQREGNYGQSA